MVLPSPSSPAPHISCHLFLTQPWPRQEEAFTCSLKNEETVPRSPLADFPISLATDAFHVWPQPVTAREGKGSCLTWANQHLPLGALGRVCLCPKRGTPDGARSGHELWTPELGASGVSLRLWVPPLSPIPREPLRGGRERGGGAG